MTNSVPENPFAFPLAGEGPNCPHFAEGMTLRDWFAGQALAALVPTVKIVGSSPEAAAAGYAEDAYVLADAMLEARSNDRG